MRRVLAMGALVLIGLVPVQGWAQFLPSPVPAIQGVWYLDGDASRPCQVRGIAGSPQVMLVNEKGERSRGQLVVGGRLAALDWDGPRGRPLWGRVLPGAFRNDDQAIAWENGTSWTRVPRYGRGYDPYDPWYP